MFLSPLNFPRLCHVGNYFDLHFILNVVVSLQRPHDVNQWFRNVFCEGWSKVGKAVMSQSVSLFSPAFASVQCSVKINRVHVRRWPFSGESCMHPSRDFNSYLNSTPVSPYREGRCMLHFNRLFFYLVWRDWIHSITSVARSFSMCFNSHCEWWRQESQVFLPVG